MERKGAALVEAAKVVEISAPEYGSDGVSVYAKLRRDRLEC